MTCIDGIPRACGFTISSGGIPPTEGTVGKICSVGVGQVPVLGIKRGTGTRNCYGRAVGASTSSVPTVNPAATLFLKEGAARQPNPFTPGTSGTGIAQTWTNLTVTDELDMLELRTALAEPGWSGLGLEPCRQ